MPTSKHGCQLEAESLAIGEISRAWVFHDSKFGNLLVEGRTLCPVSGEGVVVVGLGKTEI